MKKYPNLLGVSIITFGLSILSIFVLHFGFNIPPIDNSAAVLLSKSQIKTTTQKVFLLGGATNNTNSQLQFLNDIFSSTDGKNWKLISPQNNTTTTKWSPRQNFGYNTVFFQSKLWVIGGAKYSATTAGAIAQDIWSSTDGISWKQEGTLPFLSDEIHPVVFNNKIWVIAGANGALNNSIWSSSNGVQWVRQDTNTIVSGIQDAPWGSKYQFSFTTFKNKMWVLGGISATNSFTYTHDIWSSLDGITWVNEDTDSFVSGIQDAPWDQRQGHNALVFNDKLYILGGTNAGPGNNGYVPVNDIWSSTDGVHWNLVLAHAPWAAHNLNGSSFADVRYYHSSFVLNNNIFLIGGLMPSLSCTISGCTQPSNDVWSSPDGINWTQVTTTGDFIYPRYGFSTVVIPVSDLQI